MKRVAGKLTCLDLFCGCGGFTLGMQRAGFYVLAAIDSDPHAIATLRANLVEKHHPELLPVAYVIEADLTRFPPERLADLIGTDRVDVIVGGPPCQGFSTARQRDGANHGRRRFVSHDPRRLLYREFLRYVDYFKPRVFVMENVLGIRSAAGGEYLTRVQKEARELGYRVHGQIEDAWELGVPQKRRRQLFIGVRLDVPGYFLPHLRPAPRAVAQVSNLPYRRIPFARTSNARRASDSGDDGGLAIRDSTDWQSALPTLGDAIGDLPPLRAGSGQFEADYDFARRCDHVERRGEPARRYLVDVLEIDRADKLTNHVARPHSERDLRDFARLREGENSATAMRERGVEFLFPYDKSSFKDRYTRQHRDRPCSTIVAHLSKDGLMFIHPTQNRSLTPREAARVQSFPDWFVFPRAQTHAFRLIGNAVPPLVAEAVGLAVKEFLDETAAPAVASRALAKQTARPARKRQGAATLQDASRSTNASDGAPAFGVRQSSGAVRRNTAGPVLPEWQRAAAEELARLAGLDRRQLRRVPTDEFLRGWHALLFLFPHLHPDNALDHGTDEEEVRSDQSALPGFDALFARRYARSGWPVALALIGEEAWRRFESGEVGHSEFYNVEAHSGGAKPAHAERCRERRPAQCHRLTENEN